MDIGKSFTFVFEDEEWIVKIGLGAIILVIGILFSWVLFIPLILASLALGGYMVEIIRRLLNNDLEILPQWENWGQLLLDGLNAWVIGVVYALPIIVVGLCLGTPAGLLAEDAEGLSAFLSLIVGCFVFLYAIAMSIVLPAAIAFFVAEEDLKAAFRFGEVLGFVRENLSTYLITFIMSWVASLIGGLGSVVCGIGWLVTLPYAWMVTGHLYGQAYLASSQAQPPVLEEELEEEIA
jgi:hypothetical protein